jgi:RNA polymerase sigma-70 factor (TIGR02960 family)
VEQATLELARAGHEQAFRELTDPFRRELLAHCYRMLGSLVDAEDMLQETLLAAWRGLARFEGRSSLRSWLYRIATNTCLNAMRTATRRTPTEPTPPFRPPEPTQRDEITWLEPYPDSLLDGIADATPGPEARYTQTEAIELAFVNGLQRMPPRQRQRFCCATSSASAPTRWRQCSRPARRRSRARCSAVVLPWKVPAALLTASSRR